MSSVKEELHRIVDELPEGATYEDLLRQIRLRRKLAESQTHFERGEGDPHEEGKRLIQHRHGE